MTIESRMKPAADASLAPSEEYTRVLIKDGAYVKPAAKNPTIYYDVSMLVIGEWKSWNGLSYSHMVRLCRVRAHHDEDAHNYAEHVCYYPPREIWEP